MDPAMEFGGYVEPPTHLKQTGSKSAPEGRPAELRTVPDYDYSRFRYSLLSIPILLLILISACILMGLSFWQGPFGFKRGKNGLRNGIPMDFEIDTNSKEDAGIKNSLKGLRCANFVIGIIAIIITVFTILGNMRPGPTRIFMIIAAILLFALGCTSSVSFALGIDQVYWLKDCPDVTFPINTMQTLNTNIRSSMSPCKERFSISNAAVAADGMQAFTAFILCFVLIYTTLHRNWAWGPGAVPVEKSANQPRAQFPRPSPFTHIAQTRRTYVWMATFFCACFIIVAFILMLKMHELRIKPKMINSRGERTFTSGWSQRQNRFRVALCGFCIALCFLSFFDMAVWRRRVISYLLCIFFFWLFVGLIICFALDVREVGQAQDMTCPKAGSWVPIRCVHWPYYGTLFVDFWLLFIILIYIIYQFLYLLFAGWETYYFYADSEWLRNHSLFVEQTDREAYDWKRFTMDTGKEYYYSPSLGISTRVPPRNYVPEYVGPM